MTHSHKDLIKQWLDDPTIEFQHVCSSDVYPTHVEALLYDRLGVYKFRIKPAPKPDVVFYLGAHITPSNNIVVATRKDKGIHSNMCLTFDGETGKLKSVEML